LDYDNSNSIDFFKFCMLNTDKQRDTHNFLSNLKQEKTDGGKAMKPPLPNMLKVSKGADKSTIKPKNQDQSAFTLEINRLTFTEKIKK
jgi:hypothetical protein